MSRPGPTRFRRAVERCFQRLAGHSLLYDAIQAAAGARPMRRRLAPLLGALDRQTVLEVGAGTGRVAALLPSGAHYLWLDNDSRKIRRLRSRAGRVCRMLADATQLCLRDKSVDVGVCVAVSHHLNDDELDGVLRELARVVRQRLIFLDAIDRQESFVSRALWRLDRGRHPRPAAVLQSALAKYFEIGVTDQYTVYHTYILCVGTPRPAANDSARQSQPPA